MSSPPSDPEFGWFAYSPTSGSTFGSQSTAYQSQLHLAFDAPADPGRPPELADIRRLGTRLLQQAVKVARAGEAQLPGDLIRGHIGGGELDVLQESWETYEAVNVQVALDAWLAEDDRVHRLFGLTGYREDIALGGLLASTDRNEAGLGSVTRTNRSCGPNGATKACLDRALILVDDPRGPITLHFRAAQMQPSKLLLEAVSPVPDLAADTLASVRRLSRELNVFRGQVLSFGGDMFGFGESVLQFHERPNLQRDDLILDDDVLAAIERQVVGIARHRERLLAAGQHLKRGLLLYGPPGVGKTHTIRYLTSTLPDTTFMTISGEALQVIGMACSVARSLQPAVVVIEDVDLIAEDRGMSPGQHPLLFELLNEMDGLGGDSDIAFVLTTNRADLLEPALAARPGRVDQAIEIDLPDLDARRRLFRLYCGRLEVTASDGDIEAVLQRAEGVTASFLKELLRRAAVLAAGREAEETTGDHAHDAANHAPLQVTSEDLRAGLDDVLSNRNRMTRALLGSPAIDEPDPDSIGDLDDDGPGWNT